MKDLLEKLYWKVYFITYEEGTVRINDLYKARRSKLTYFVQVFKAGEWVDLDEAYESLFRRD